ncbi:hypothetical protein PC116_g28625 [Phytophthora cactorum]|nr:hypothetical protein PC116_g28625 [Phytophthora cactorum]
MFFAWLGTICLCALQLLMMEHGGGVNIWDVPEDELKKFLEVSLRVFFSSSSPCCKTNNTSPNPSYSWMFKWLRGSPSSSPDYLSYSFIFEYSSP